MAVYQFGSGVLVGKQIGVTPPGSREFGVLQDVSVDFTATNKPLMGQYQFPVAVGRGGAKITCKARFGRIYAALFNDLFFNSGQVTATTQTIMVADEAGTVPGVTPFTVTVVNPGVISDLGVKDLNGLYLTRASSVTTAAQYSVNEATGVYTFHSTRAAQAVSISYTYSKTSAGPTVTLTNPLLGSATFFEAHLKQVYGGKNLYLKLNSCISSKLALATKLEDFTIPELDFDAFADGANNIGSIAIDE